LEKVDPEHKIHTEDYTEEMKHLIGDENDLDDRDAGN
jgi:hypothetical protein